MAGVEIHANVQTLVSLIQPHGHSHLEIWQVSVRLAVFTSLAEVGLPRTSEVQPVRVELCPSWGLLFGLGAGAWAGSVLCLRSSPGTPHVFI